ncbi:MAG: type II toxin-antitoxin system YafQ family toxin [Bacteroidales bacterium]|jgi:mRNA interferase YafQ|nr:type II toxin-antitoxin system YafQ family toxin [Bacteroidales bacterium]
MYYPKRTGQFKKDYKLCSKRNYDLKLLDDVIEKLVISGKLPQKYNPHPLQGTYNGYKEAHIEPNWLIIWKTEHDCPSGFEGTLHLTRTGTHSDLFKK